MTLILLVFTRLNSMDYEKNWKEFWNDKYGFIVIH
jgi:hypothetical protein